MVKLIGYTIKERYGNEPKLRYNSFYEEQKYDQKIPLQEVKQDKESEKTE